MTTPVLGLPLSTPDISPAKKKRVLDTSRTKPDMRADETTTATETTPEREELL
jgi:hypothetical protein